MRNARRFLLLIALLILVSACGGNRADLEQWVAQEKAKRGAPLPPVPVIKTFESFEYRDQDLRDPFGASKAEQEQASTDGPHPDENRTREILELYPLDGLKMMGTLGTGRNMEALIQDPDRIIHRIRAGNYVGQNFGRVVALSEGRIDIVELVPNGSGGWIERQASMALSEIKK